jgi:hypothetical protein
MSGFASRLVLQFGRTWLDRFLPPRTQGRIFLVGGAYKSLRHGRPPRDLDLFCADARSRQELLASLRMKGASSIADNPPYQETLCLDELRIDVAYDTTQSTLEARIGCTDIALSAVGCERGPDGDRALVHPLAKESTARRQILLLTPLVNWKYALYTLERMHRYAQELDFVVPEEQEEYVWRLFLAQSSHERDSMIRRYERVSDRCEPIRTRARSLSKEDSP